MRSKLAVGVYVHSFQNLDLLTQGWYALRCFVRRARDQESGLMDEVIEVPLPVESAAERVPADSSLDWIAIRAPPLTIKERRRREARAAAGGPGAGAGAAARRAPAGRLVVVVVAVVVVAVL